MLNNFFKINFPYGIMVNENNEWTCFNREYKPLGYKDAFEEVQERDFIYCKYKGLTKKILNKLGDREGSIKLESGKIKKVFFYSDNTNPSNSSDRKLHNNYFKKLEILFALKVQ